MARKKKLANPATIRKAIKALRSRKNPAVSYAEFLGMDEEEYESVLRGGPKAPKPTVEDRLLGFGLTPEQIESLDLGARLLKSTSPSKAIAELEAKLAEAEAAVGKASASAKSPKAPKVDDIFSQGPTKKAPKAPWAQGPSVADEEEVPWGPFTQETPDLTKKKISAQKVQGLADKMIEWIPIQRPGSVREETAYAPAINGQFIVKSAPGTLRDSFRESWLTQVTFKAKRQKKSYEIMLKLLQHAPEWVKKQLELMEE